MLKLTRREKKTLKKILDHMRKECHMFNGFYDAENGKTEFMYGVELPLEYLAYMVSEDYYDEFDETFIKNLMASKTMARERSSL